ncbi:MAG TPA: ferredoxin [Verrucomicrobiota bacterium]|jgi:ferredoxin|nr:ferredoxin [Verrucomicrobiota bacterium]
MAVLADRFEKNAPGRYYCDSRCIDCGLCREICPEIFVRCEAGRHSCVRRQPETPGEEELCQEALGYCPVEAIGDDGQQENL